MANRSLFTTLIRRVKHQLGATSPWRPISSKSSPLNVTAQSGIGNKDLMSEILRLKSPKRSAITLLQNRAEQGHKLSISELRRITRQLIKSKRHDHALEIVTWMENRNGFRMSPGDHTVKLELIIKVCGLREGEDYFTRLIDSASKKAACLALLHGYVKERDTKNAEALMVKLSGMGLIVTTHPFNEMMKLYMATSQCEKVPLVIQQMKRNNLPRNVLSYNLWMNACGEVSGVASAEMVYKEMVSDKNIQVGWSTLSTLANVYIKAGLVDKAILVLKNAEEKLSTCNRLGYFFLITLYASLNDKEGVLRLWEGSKAVGGRITCSNYMCVLSCLVKLGDIVEAERIFMEWESSFRNYDIRVSNVLLGAYMRSGMIDKAESLHLHTLERGGCPNYKTWEILMEGWVKSQNMVKAINAMKKGFAMLKHCDWRPSHGILMAMAEYFEKHGSFEDVNWYIRLIHRFGLASLPLYKSLLRMHLQAKRPAFDILKMMEKDKIEMDDETSALVQAFNV
ncbi:pentatricopeptide repeat-containing protein At5g27460 [Quercus robur]|uniref:pentatricopeptide repeat-containing protein At5g27460 n=1 Tax=Quercus robur TaxID=38942 RepID=UPI002163F711|nr:pentatricopeptide repeat-containing protein At5g27460 [Quercus robur]XP_050254411.1 pentatricopeptide repeat-containing protein At5g27460 [Quercus robur]